MIDDNGAEALQSVESLRPALDIRLRGDQDGIETADLIRRNFHVHVMFVTAFARSERQRLAIERRARFERPGV